MDNAPRVMIVEDDERLATLTSDYLSANGLSVTVVSNGNEAIRRIPAEQPDIVVLDLMLPGADGLTVCREVRRQYRNPILMLTARTDDMDQILGLEMGADDYVVKPFSARELLARVEAVLRRCAPSGTGKRILPVGDATLDLQRREVRWPGGERHDLSETETDLLEYLLANSNRAVSREELLQHVWGIRAAGLETRTIDMHIVRLRAKFRSPDGDPSPEAIVTVRGVGYMAGAGLSEGAAT